MLHSFASHCPLTHDHANMSQLLIGTENLISSHISYTSLHTTVSASAHMTTWHYTNLSLLLLYLVFHSLLFAFHQHFSEAETQRQRVHWHLHDWTGWCMLHKSFVLHMTFYNKTPVILFTQDAENSLLLNFITPRQSIGKTTAAKLRSNFQLHINRIMQKTTVAELDMI